MTDDKRAYYQVTENQLNLVTTFKNAWRDTMFWALMYMQSFLFHAENVDNIRQELQKQPNEYERIMREIYGVTISSSMSEHMRPMVGFYTAYLDEIMAHRHAQALELKKNWLAASRQATQRLGALNPNWSPSVWQTMVAHVIDLLCDAADNDMLGRYKAISRNYLILDRLAADMGEYMAVGIIRQFQIA